MLLSSTSYVLTVLRARVIHFIIYSIKFVHNSRVKPYEEFAILYRFDNSLLKALTNIKLYYTRPLRFELHSTDSSVIIEPNRIAYRVPKVLFQFKGDLLYVYLPFLARSRVSFSSMESFTQNNLEDSESSIISPKDNTDNDTNEYVDRSVNSIWQCMKRIDTNLDYFAKIFNVEQSPERKLAKMDDDEFLYLFPLTEVDDVFDLESRLLDDCFKKKFIAYITPKSNLKCLCKSDQKYFVRTLLRRLFTYSLASCYSWCGFGRNFQIKNLTIVQVIFDITKSKFKTVSKQFVNLIIKEWIRYTKQRCARLKKMNSS